MFNNKYSNFLTVLLIVAIIGIIALIGYFGYDIYMKYYTEKEALVAAEEFEEQVRNDNNTNTDIEDPGDIDGLNSDTNLSNSSGGSTTTYKGYIMIGTIEIPKVSIKYPILDRVTPRSIQSAVAVLYGPGLNQVGNTVIVGHNYRNGSLFSNLKKVSNGDTIYITDTSGSKVKYTVFNIYQTTAEDSSYITRDTAGRKEISLSTCTDDGKGRIIVWAKAD